MMRHLCKTFMVFLLLVPASVMADSYTALWKQYNSAERKDMPKTQLRVLDRILQKATATTDYGQLLKARLLRAAVQTHISYDSLKSEVGSLEAEAVKVKDGDPVLYAVYASALGRIYQEHQELSDAKVKSKEYFRLSMQNPDMLAALKAEGYEPFAVEGVDSKIFYDDLLHVIGFAAADYKVLHDWYLKHGNRAAACICAFKMTQKERFEDVAEVRRSKYLQTIDSLINEYQDLRECGELAIERYRFMEQAEDASAEDRYNYVNYALSRWGAWPRMNILRNAKAQLTLPSFQVSLNGGVAMPGRKHDIYVTSLTNVQELTLTVTRTGLNGDTHLDPNDKKDYEKIRKGLSASAAFSQTHHFYGQPTYKVMSDTLTVDPLPVGVYLVEFTTDNAQISPKRALLYVSDVYTMVQQNGEHSFRIATVSAITGKPLAGTTVQLRFRKPEKSDSIVTLTTDARGEVIYAPHVEVAEGAQHVGKFADQLSSIFAFTDSDKANRESAFYTRFKTWKVPNEERRHVQLFTDRSLYRPGQTVHVALVATRNQTATEEVADGSREITITLRDANYKTIRQQQVVTDAYGTASADFVLPASALTGRFSVRAASSSVSFRVEEYKRPTYEVVFDTVRVAYHSGDTVRVTGYARTYSGMPVQGAQVKYTVRRAPARYGWWRGGVHAARVDLGSDTLVTDEKGSFVIPVPMTMPQMKKADRQWYNFTASVEVTDGAGESHEDETTLLLGSQPTLLRTTFPDKILRDSLRDITFTYLNAGGQEIAGNVTYSIRMGDIVGRYTAEANRTTQLADELKNLPSGRYTLEAQCGTDTLSHEFVVFTMNDQHPASDTRDWFYQSSSEFPMDGQPVYIQLGSSDDVHIVYSAFANGKEIAQGAVDQQNAVKTLKLNYKEEYGDELLVTCAWVRNGLFYSHTASIRKPLPDKRLSLRWTSFRDRLRPGQQETWTLHIERPEGWNGIGQHRAASAAKAQLLAVLYDKSLDAIYPHSWSFSNHSYTSGTSLSWSKGGVRYERNIYGEQPYKALVERNLDFTHWDEDCFALWSSRPMAFALEGRIAGLDVAPKAEVVMAKANSLAEVDLNSYSRVADAQGATASADLKETDGEEHSTADGAYALRENLNETAFFYPNLETDDNGNIQLKFTLPESVTTWKFMGLAHDKQANHGLLDGEAVARKTVMIQPNLPRFVRKGDKVQVTSRVMNSSEEAVSGRATLLLLNPETEKTVYKASKNYKVEAGATAHVTMDVPTEGLEGTLYIVRVVAEGRGYSDGEQHYLPLLPDKELVTNTVPFTQNVPGTKTIDLEGITSGQQAKITVEYTNNPAWLMIQALPYVAKSYEENAVSLAAAYYANALGKDILSSVPSIKTTGQQWQREESNQSLQSALEKNQELKNIVLNETPWMMEAETESDQKQMLFQFFDDNQLQQRQDDVFNKLRKLQRADGSFSWWPGMPGSVCMTEAVAKMLVRLNAMIGQQQQTATMIAQAYGFLQKEIAREVEWMKKEEKQGAKDLVPSETACDFLYISAMSGHQATADIDYLLSKLEKQPAKLTIYGKAMSAIILSKYGKAQKAGEYLQSVNEYTVYKEDMGRYFDSPKALYSWFDYRIPSQVAAIEAMKALTPDETVRMDEMRQWLLQEKRTQQWSTPINTVDAVYAFFGEGEGKLSTKSKLGSKEHPVLYIDGKQLQTVAATAGLGYVKSFSEGRFKTFVADKTSEGTSWGAVYAQFWQKSTDIDHVSAGLRVTRELVGDVQNLRMGDKVKVRITIVADRDYDFVQVSDKRAACMEPVSQLSGYRWGYYLAPKDNVTNYYFDRMNKGTHVVETEYYIDRSGTYQTGTCTVQCAYSPEFTARDKALVLEVK